MSLERTLLLHLALHSVAQYSQPPPVQHLPLPVAVTLRAGHDEQANHDEKDEDRDLSNSLTAEIPLAVMPRPLPALHEAT